MPERRPTFDAETLELFVRLEHMRTVRARSNPAFRASERTLAKRLNLTDEWWRGSSVLDRSRAPAHPPGYFAHDDWHRVRAVREQLLAAVRAAREPTDASNREAAGADAATRQ